MSKDYRFNKKDYGFDEERSVDGNASDKHFDERKMFAKHKPKTSFKRVDKRSFA
ncbi:hypothetical protein ACFO4O_10690 [Glaciecola siphonariae]|uniref:Uncharacterized protein n=1 Tax=Glaciecola siphonariae TaxID=521012 RepID=A0ABV9LYD8_9ALTE